MAQVVEVVIRKFPPIVVEAVPSLDIVRVYTPEQEMQFTRAELRAVIPHQQEAYLSSRMNLFRKLIEPRITPTKFRDPRPSAPTTEAAKRTWQQEYQGEFVNEETRKDVEADIMKAYYESRKRSFRDDFKRSSQYRKWNPDDSF